MPSELYDSFLDGAILAVQAVRNMGWEARQIVIGLFVEGEFDTEVTLYKP